MKILLIIYHSQSGNTEQLAAAVLRGARRETEVETILKRAQDTGLADLLRADALLIGSPENFGSLAGAVKDFFDRTYYPAQEQGIHLPYAVFISAGNDGSGAVRQIERIAVGFPLKKIAEPLLCVGPADEAILQACDELGQAAAAGLSMGIY
jgi:multimeric flavodoxin WrbA